MSELLELSVTELNERLRSRKASPVELMEAVLARIDATNGDLNAFVALRDRDALLADARASEQRIAKGEARKLEGIPLGVKDLENTEGLTNTKGSLVFKDRISDHDDTQIARLKAAGAIVVGKTNAPEFGYTAITKNLVYGVSRNPWSLDHTPGGSSGGSAAALAGCVCPMNTASDGGGSIRIPACFVGAYGLKVSFGRVPRGPLEYWATDDTSVYGPLTKTVADAALQLDVTAGVSPTDPNSLPDPGYSYVDKLAEGLPRKLRIGYSPDLGHAVVQSDIAAAVEDAARVFEKLGHSVTPVPGRPAPDGPGVGPARRLGAGGAAARLPPRTRGGLRSDLHRGRQPGAAEHDARGLEEDQRRAHRAPELVRADLLGVRRADHAHGPLRRAAREGSLPVRDRGAPAACSRRGLVHHPLQSLLASGRHPAGRRLAGRSAHRDADRRAAPS